MKKLGLLVVLSVMVVGCLLAKADILVEHTWTKEATIAPERAIIPCFGVKVTNTGKQSVTVSFTLQALGNFVEPSDPYAFARVHLYQGNFHHDLFPLIRHQSMHLTGHVGAGETVECGFALRMGLDLAEQAGSTIGIALTGVHAGVTAFSSLPIQGAIHTVNASLEIGRLAISRSEAIPDGSVLGRAPAQSLGGFRIDNGFVEDVVTTTPMQFLLWASDKSAVITSLYLVDEQGQAAAGPVDALPLLDVLGTNDTGFLECIFSDGVRIPKGGRNFTLKGKVSSASHSTITTWASRAQLIGIGQVYGFLISDDNSGMWWVQGPTMTIRNPELKVSFIQGSGSGVAVAGSRQVILGEYVLDATESSEDIRVVTLGGSYSFGGDGGATDLTNLGLYDGATAVTTGSNRVNPTQTGPQRFTLDGTGIIVARGTVRHLQLRSDVRSGVIRTMYVWCVDSTVTSAVGLQTAQNALVAVTPPNSVAFLVVQSGTVTIQDDLRSPIHTIGGREFRTDVELLGFSLTASTEPFEVKSLTCRMTGLPASRFADILTAFDWWSVRLMVGDALVNFGNFVPKLENGGEGIVSIYFGDLSGLMVPIGTTLRLKVVIDVDLWQRLKTADSLKTSVESLRLVGYNSGRNVEADTSLLAGSTVTFRRVPLTPRIGDLTGNGIIGPEDLDELDFQLQHVQMLSERAERAGSTTTLIAEQIALAQRMPQGDVFPDWRINELDRNVLHRYLRGELLTLPLGDASFDWRLTTFDITLTRGHILGRAPSFYSPYQSRQVDMQGDGSVTTLDISLMRRLILGNYYNP